MSRPSRSLASSAYRYLTAASPTSMHRSRCHRSPGGRYHRRASVSRSISALISGSSATAPRRSRHGSLPRAGVPDDRRITCMARFEGGLERRGPGAVRRLHRCLRPEIRPPNTRVAQANRNIDHVVHLSTEKRPARAGALQRQTTSHVGHMRRPHEHGMTADPATLDLSTFSRFVRPSSRFPSYLGGAPGRTSDCLQDTFPTGVACLTVSSIAARAGAGSRLGSSCCFVADDDLPCASKVRCAHAA